MKFARHFVSVSLTNYPANFVEIDEIFLDAEHCDGKL